MASSKFRAAAWLAAGVVSAIALASGCGGKTMFDDPHDTGTSGAAASQNSGGASAGWGAGSGGRTSTGGSTHAGAPGSVDAGPPFDASVPGDSSVGGSGPDDAGLDVQVPDDAEPDADTGDSGCRADSDCTDAVSCTADHCVAGVCVNTPSDAQCDNHMFCDGVETCSATAGCVSGPAPCVDAVACTRDSCDETSAQCHHEPDDSSCAVSHACDPALDCQARAFAVDNSGHLLDVRLPSGNTRVIGVTPTVLTDIALTADGRLFGVGFDSVWRIDPETAEATQVASTTPGIVNAMDAAPDFTLYVAGGSRLYTLDATTGELVLVMTFEPHVSSGDLAFLGDRLLMTVAGTADSLLELDPVAKTTRLIGGIGESCIYGLAAYGPTLYGLTCSGFVLSIDPNTAASTRKMASRQVFWGATAR